MDLIPMPTAFLAFRLRGRLGCQMHMGIGHRGYSENRAAMFHKMPLGHRPERGKLIA